MEQTKSRDFIDLMEHYARLHEADLVLRAWFTRYKIEIVNLNHDWAVYQGSEIDALRFPTYAHAVQYALRIVNAVNSRRIPDMRASEDVIEDLKPDELTFPAVEEDSAQ